MGERVRMDVVQHPTGADPGLSEGEKPGQHHLQKEGGAEGTARALESEIGSCGGLGARRTGLTASGRPPPRFALPLVERRRVPETAARRKDRKAWPARVHARRILRQDVRFYHWRPEGAPSEKPALLSDRPSTCPSVQAQARLCWLAFSGQDRVSSGHAQDPHRRLRPRRRPCP